MIKVNDDFDVMHIDLLILNTIEDVIVLSNAWLVSSCQAPPMMNAKEPKKGRKVGWSVWKKKRIEENDEDKDEKRLISAENYFVLFFSLFFSVPTL